MKTYIITLENSTLIKIGKSKDLSSRIRQIRTANPFVKECHFVDGDYENYLHRCLTIFRVRGEWFELHDAPIIDVFNMLIDIRIKSKNECEAVYKVMEILQINK